MIGMLWEWICDTDTHGGEACALGGPCADPRRELLNEDVGVGCRVVDVVTTGLG